MMKWGLALIAFMSSFATSVPALAGCRGAIAYNQVTKDWGEGHGYDSLADAENAALSVCPGGCGIVAWTNSGYVALATGDGGAGWSSAQSTAEAAESVAISECAGVTTNCAWRVWVSGCN
jgi:hypothetical protein